MQKITILGHMGKDPEQRSTKNGVTLLTFSVAVNYSKNNTTWYDVVIWEKKRPLFSAIMPHLSKGSKVIIGGTLMPVRIYTNKMGESTAQLSIEPDFINFAPSAKKEEGTGSPSVFEKKEDTQEDVPF